MRAKFLCIPFKKLTPTEMAGLVMSALETNRCYWNEVAVVLDKVKEATEQRMTTERISYKGTAEVEAYQMAMPVCGEAVDALKKIGGTP